MVYKAVEGKLTKSADKAKAAEDAALAAAKVAQAAAGVALFKESALNATADKAIKDWQGAKDKASKAKAKALKLGYECSPR